jgi:hypothetical protein
VATNVLMQPFQVEQVTTTESARGTAQSAAIAAPGDGERMWLDRCRGPQVERLGMSLTNWGGARVLESVRPPPSHSHFDGAESDNCADEEQGERDPRRGGPDQFLVPAPSGDSNKNEADHGALHWQS